MPYEFDVVIVGGGPVGLALGCELRLADVSVLVLERRLTVDTLARAGSMGPLAFEALERLGLREDLLQAEQETLATYAHMFSAWAAATGNSAEPSRKAPKEHFGGIEKLDPNRRTDPGRCRVRVEQPTLEAILERHALASGVHLRRGHEIVGLDQDEEGASIDVRCDRAGYLVRTQYVVGCDGANSTIRQLAGFTFVGTDPSVTGRMAVVELADPEKLQPGFHFTANGLYVHGLGVNRLSTVEFHGPPAEATPLTTAELQDSIRRVSNTDVTITEMSEGTRWIDTAKQASVYRRGRVLLAGDSAHVYAPVGGQGLNVGLVDAANLGWKLAAQVNRWAPYLLLDSYEAERAPAAARLLQNTRAQIALMRPDPQSTALRELVDELMDIDAVHRHIADMLAGMDLRYDLGSDDQLVGTLLADMKLTSVHPGGRLADEPTSLIDLLRDGAGVLLDFADRAEIRAAAAGWPRVALHTGQPERDDLDALLIRPDGCVAWALPAGGTFEPGSLHSALRTFRRARPRYPMSTHIHQAVGRSKPDQSDRRRGRFSWC
jgi:2-polyprenyl-6-methoxyphenol hydroxylase-like FAD-dependent oxidoreductase